MNAAEARVFAHAVARDMDDLKREKAALREQRDELLGALKEIDGEPMARLPYELWMKIRATIAKAEGKPVPA